MATEIGEMVTIDVEEVPDLRRVTLTLLLPEILLNDGWVEVPFSTQGILTTHHTSIAGPGLLEGARQTYRCLSLAGTARIAQFFSRGSRG